MSVIGFLAVCWLVAYAAAGGLPNARRRLIRLTGHPRRRAEPVTAGTVATVPARTADATVSDPEVPTSFVDIECAVPVPEPEGISAEGRLVAAMLAGTISVDRYRKAMHVLAARDDRAHPVPPVPS